MEEKLSGRSAATEEVAREQASIKTGYSPETIGRVSLISDEGNNSRQVAFIFETSHDVTEHPLYAKARFSEVFDLAGKGVSDGPLLQFGREVTVGG
ncbi:hypothetical protein HNQ96_006196 [Aminobacter lissarensis]|uniref:Uncharacterized protein n=1 Tax=Aminobacter carboxidus TaxID=376165 RepID=A0A8E1WM26_9HYPH|nr:hypothetical protein [Aminobacter lissarensis]MBB6470299.1 hypothetical protein [Aminobacter lissarensis]